MVERYISNAEPLTPHQQEMLDILVEECAEVIHRSMKISRFGLLEQQEGHEPNNIRLGLEIGQLLHMVRVVEDLGFFSDDILIKGMIQKEEKLKKYIQHLEEEP